MPEYAKNTTVSEQNPFRRLRARSGAMMPRALLMGGKKKRVTKSAWLRSRPMTALSGSSYACRCAASS